MRNLSSRRRLACHHEAGHALVRWFFGHATDRIFVSKIEDFRAGIPIIDSYGRRFMAEGLCEGYDIIDYPYGPGEGFHNDRANQNFENKSRLINRDMELINCHAGFVAEAFYMKTSINARMFAGGTRDIEHARTIINAWNLEKKEQEDLANQAIERTVALVRSRYGNAAIKAIASMLIERGELNGEELAVICIQVYDGYIPHYAEWLAYWPPTIEELKIGRRASHNINIPTSNLSASL